MRRSIMQRKLALPIPKEVCYVCGKKIDTENEHGFSSTIRHIAGVRQYFHLDCAQHGDPITLDEVIAEEDKYR